MKYFTKKLSVLFFLMVLTACGGDSTSENEASSDSPDKTKPVITLVGKDSIEVIKGKSFADPGATAVDNIDGIVNVKVSGIVDTQTVGSYPLIYSAQDKAGNTARKTRHVLVIPVPMVHQVNDTDGLRNALYDSRNNHTSDIIILQEGTYKTSDDGGGTFNFTDIESHNLTIKAASGLQREKVILDGNHEDLVLSHASTHSTHPTLVLEGITIRNGNNSDNGHGAGIYTAHHLRLINSHIIGNNNVFGSNGRGAGVHVRKNAYIERSLINNNRAYSSAGVSVIGFADIFESTISGNIATWVGGGVSAGRLTVRDSTISHNKASSGGGMKSKHDISCENSTISYNQANSAAAISGSPTVINHCEIVGNINNINDKKGVVNAGTSLIIGSIFKDNKGALLSSAPAIIVNNTFNNNDGVSYISGRLINNVFDMGGIDLSTGVSNIYNNYFDTHTLEENNRTVILRDNVQPSDGLLNLDSNLVPTADSVLVNRGLNMQKNEFKELFKAGEKFQVYDDYTIYNRIVKMLQKDYEGKNRIVGGTIDIGANEKQ